MNKLDDNRDIIIDDIVLDTIYKREDKFTFHEIEDEMMLLFEKNGIDYDVYGMLVGNALIRLLIIGRFEIVKNRFVCRNSSVLLNEHFHDELIDLKNKATYKYGNKKKILKKEDKDSIKDN